MLPEDKRAFPKLLCLDTNKWIDLGRAHYGREGGARFRPALDAVRAGVASGRLVVAASIINTLEAGHSADAGRRERLTDFISATTNDNWLAPLHSVLGLELVSLTHALAGHRGTPVRPRLVGRGISVALGADVCVTGGTPEVRAEVLKLIAAPGVMAEAMLAVAADRERVAESRRLERDALPGLEDVRTHARRELNPDQRYIVDFLKLIGDPRTCGTPLVEMLKAASVPFDDAVHWLTSDGWRERHQATLPSVYCGLTLNELCPDNRAIHENDTRDQFWLQSALPYANAIVMERFWAGVIQRSSLDSLYETAVLTNAADLPSLLSDMGC